MSDALLRTVVRVLFFATSRERVAKQASASLATYSNLANGLGEEDGRRTVRVPPMRGVDEDMREWSFFMILEHNRIVNRCITSIVRQLAMGEPLSGDSVIDPKSDVMPSPDVGPDVVERFRNSVHEHLEAVASLGKLRGTRTTRHPVFGEFDAHQWNCMFALHLKIHIPQATHVVRTVRAEFAEQS